MASRWPDMFFGTAVTGRQPVPIAQALPLLQRRDSLAPHPTGSISLSASAKPAGASLWPEMFFPKPSAPKAPPAQTTPTPAPDLPFPAFELPQPLPHFTPVPPAPADSPFSFPPRPETQPFPKIDLTRKPTAPPNLAPSAPLAPAETPLHLIVPKPPTSLGTREFVLKNGERVSGTVISETTEAIYLKSETMGTLTLSRAQISDRLAEIILINGDRVVGEIISETPEFVYLRNTSLGTLTIPRAHIGRRVAEAVLHNGDRIVGEMISDTAELLLMKSAALGTLTVLRSGVQQLSLRREVRDLEPLPAPADSSLLPRL
jgi:hypothetical protein